MSLTFAVFGMAYVRRFTEQTGETEPLPRVLPLNAFYLIPILVALLSAWLVR